MRMLACDAASIFWRTVLSESESDPRQNTVISNGIDFHFSRAKRNTGTGQARDCEETPSTTTRITRMVRRTVATHDRRGSATRYLDYPEALEHATVSASLRNFDRTPALYN